MATTSPANPFIKQLASSGSLLCFAFIANQSNIFLQDKIKRDTALESLHTYISKRTAFDELELLKLWKGLFFCTINI